MNNLLQSSLSQKLSNYAKSTCIAFMIRYIHMGKQYISLLIEKEDFGQEHFSVR